MNVFEIVDRLGKKEYFFIFFIVIFSIGLIKLIQPDYALVIGLILGCVIVFFYISKFIYVQDNSKNTLINQYNSLLIKPDPLLLNYTNIITFLYDMHEYYDYNLTAMNELMVELNNFFILYHSLVSNNYTDCEYTFDNLTGIKLKLVNILSTYIYSIPDDIYLMDNLADKQQAFDNMLQEYLNNISNKCDIDSFKKSKPMPANMLQ